MHVDRGDRDVQGVGADLDGVFHLEHAGVVEAADDLLALELRGNVGVVHHGVLDLQDLLLDRGVVAAAVAHLDRERDGVEIGRHGEGLDDLGEGDVQPVVEADHADEPALAAGDADGGALVFLPVRADAEGLGDDRVAVLQADLELLDGEERGLGDLAVRRPAGQTAVDDAQREGIVRAEAVHDDLIGGAQIHSEAGGQLAVGPQQHPVGIRQRHMDPSIRFSQKNAPVPI